MSKANNSVVSVLSTLTKHATISQSESFFRMVQIIGSVDQATKSLGRLVSRKLMQPLGAEPTNVNRKSKTKLTVKVQCFRLGGKKLNGSLNKAKNFTVSYKSHHPTETYW